MKRISMWNLSRFNPGTSPAINAIKAMRYIWSAIDSAPFIPWLTHPFLFVIYKAYTYDKETILFSFNMDYQIIYSLHNIQTHMYSKNKYKKKYIKLPKPKCAHSWQICIVSAYLNDMGMKLLLNIIHSFLNLCGFSKTVLIVNHQ